MAYVPGEASERETRLSQPLGSVHPVAVRPAGADESRQALAKPVAPAVAKRFPMPVFRADQNRPVRCLSPGLFQGLDENRFCRRLVARGAVDQGQVLGTDELSDQV